MFQGSVDLIGKQALANKDLIQDEESDMSEGFGLNCNLSGIIFILVVGEDVSAGILFSNSEEKNIYLSS